LKHRVWLRQGAAFGFFCLLACIVLYWPLFHVGTHIPNNIDITDYFHFNWNFWWVRHALTTPGLNVYETNYVLFPFTHNLGYHTLMLSWYPVWAVFEPLIGTLGAMQIIILVATSLTGYICFLLLRREGVSAGLALVGGAVYQLTPAMYSALLFTTPNYLNFFWPPLQLLIWGELTRNARRGWQIWAWGIILGISLYAMVMTDSQFVIYTALLLVPYGLLTLYRAKSWNERAQQMGSGLIAIILAVGLLWFAGPLRYMLAFDRSTLAPPPAEEAYSIPFPGGYFSRDPNDIRAITLGAVVVPLVLVSLFTPIPPSPFLRIRRKGGKDNSRQETNVGEGLKPSPINRSRFSTIDRRWFWLAVGILPLVLSVGASITIAETTIPMPYRLLHEAMGGMLRSAHRFGMIFIIPAMIFVGQTWTPILAKRTLARLIVPVVLMAFVFLDARLFFPMPIQPVVPPYDFYERIGQETGEPYDDEVVLEVPTSGGSGEIWVGQFNELKTQFYGITHGKRMVNGLISRTPISSFWYLRTDDPLLSWLGQRRFLEPDLAEPELRKIIYEWPIGYIVVHQDLIGRVGPTAQEVVGYLNSLPDLVCPIWVEGNAVVYRTAWHPDSCPARTPPEVQPGVYRIDVGAEGDEKFIGWGWHWPEDIAGVSLRWTGEYPQTQIYVDLPPGAYDISLSAQSFWEARQLTVLVNGVALQPHPLTPSPQVERGNNTNSVSVLVEGLTTFTFHVPAAVVVDGRNLVVTLDYDGVIVPVEVGQSADERRLALAVDWVEFVREER
jgi:hypothetical protein